MVQNWIIFQCWKSEESGRGKEKSVEDASVAYNCSISPFISSI
jgi:hypothetical protein